MLKEGRREILWRNQNMVQVFLAGFPVGLKTVCKLPVFAHKLICIFVENSANLAGFQPLLFYVNSYRLCPFLLT
jgi:hypothetical protein